MVEAAKQQANDVAELLGRLARLASLASREDAVCCGVTVAQCHILLSLLEAGSVTMQSLSTHLGIAPSTLTRNIEPLVKLGWVARERVERDRRQVVVGLSQGGRKKAEELKTVQQESCQRLLEGLPAKERKKVLAAMNTFLAVLEREMIERCCP